MRKNNDLYEKWRDVLDFNFVTIEIPVLSNVIIRGNMKAVCPVDGSIDVYHFEIEYFGNNKFIELNSLKEFLGKFEGREVFHEELAWIIANKLRDALGSYVRVKLVSHYKGLEVVVESRAPSETGKPHMRS